MSEEEKRRCILLGICQTAGRPGDDAPAGNRLDTLREYLSTSTLSDNDAQVVLGLIDEALAMQGA